jgi:hypothetical protein
VKTRTCSAGYGAVGTELEAGAVALRLEARDYLTCFESPVTGDNRTRNDLGLALRVEARTWRCRPGRGAAEPCQGFPGQVFPDFPLGKPTPGTRLPLENDLPDSHPAFPERFPWLPT